MKPSTTPAGYLTKLQAAFLAVHDQLDPEDKEDWELQFHREADRLGLSAGLSASLRGREEVELSLSPENPDAWEWAQGRIMLGRVPVPKNPESPFEAFDVL